MRSPPSGFGVLASVASSSEKLAYGCTGMSAFGMAVNGSRES